MIGLESAFGLVQTILSDSKISSEQIIQWMTIGAAKVMGWELKPFAVDSLAEISIIDPNLQWKFSEQHIKSRSKNSPMFGMKFKGKVMATICGKHSFGINLD